jgi:hypothetical protein
MPLYSPFHLVAWETLFHVPLLTLQKYPNRMPADTRFGDGKLNWSHCSPILGSMCSCWITESPHRTCKGDLQRNPWGDREIGVCVLWFGGGACYCFLSGRTPPAHCSGEEILPEKDAHCRSGNWRILTSTSVDRLPKEVHLAAEATRR